MTILLLQSGPGRVSAGVSFATFDGAPSTSNITLSNGNLTVTKNVGPGSGQVSSTTLYSSGKYYFELKFAQRSIVHSIGIALATAVAGDLPNGLNCTIVQPGGASLIYSNNVSTGKDLGAAGSADLYCFAIDLTNRLGWIRKGAGNWNADASANPATGVNGVVIAAGSFAPTVYFASGGLNDNLTADFGASAFSGAVPSGFTSGWPR